MFKNKCNIIGFFVKIWYNFLYEIIKTGGKIIKKLHPDKKKWLITRNKKLQRLHSKSKKITKSNNIFHHKNKTEGKCVYKKEVKQLKAVAPTVLSIIYNPDVTIKYFNDIILKMQSKEFNLNFYFDLQYVEQLTIDALMYILAILKNIKHYKIYKYSCSGNQPLNERPRKLMQESGFFKYVKSEQKFILPSSDKIQITSGRMVDSDIVKSICDFVNEKCCTIIKFTSPLYITLIELMTNTVQHAYSKNFIKTLNNWFVFVEDQEDKIKFIFLDTGDGIPKTINKRLKEKLFNLTDSEYIRSALKGEFRTETKSKSRGKGLPSITDYCLNNIFENFTVFSGNGSCQIKDGYDDFFLLNEIENKIFGTLFFWEINKTNISEEYKND